MKTPAGKECKYFFGDYFRGRNIEECNLLSNSERPQEWKASLCFTCPVPGIIQANACPNLELSAVVYRPFYIMKSRMLITSTCSKTMRKVKEPHIGCGECHPLPSIFTGEDIDTDSAG